MLKVFFQETTDGRLLRLPYLGYSILLHLLLVLVMVGLAVAIGAGEMIVGGELEQAQAQLAESFSLPFILITLLVVALFLFSNLNIMAKRIRDTGLPGWWTVAAIILIGIVLSALVTEQAGSGFQTLCWVALLLLPSGCFSGPKQ